MSLHDWLLFLHVLAAFAVVASVVLLAVAITAATLAGTPSRAAAALSLTGPAGRLFDTGGFGTLVFGIWLVFEADGYAIWDGWIVAALVLWLVAAASGGAAGRAYRGARRLAEQLASDGGARSNELRHAVLAPRALAAQSVAATAILALLVLMIFKPGAG